MKLAKMKFRQNRRDRRQDRREDRRDTGLDTPDVEVPDAAEELKGKVEEIQDHVASAQKAGLAFKLWFAKNLSCCLGTPEITKPAIL